MEVVMHDLPLDCDCGCTETEGGRYLGFFSYGHWDY